MALEKCRHRVIWASMKKALVLPLALVTALAALVFAQQDRRQVDRNPKSKVTEKGVRIKVKER